MALIKSGDISAPAPVQKVEAPTPAPLRGRDFDKEARGKTRCSLYAAALQSPVLQQYFYAKEADLEEIKKTLRILAEDGVKYTFGEE